jgi:hypothetical protein
VRVSAKRIIVEIEGTVTTRRKTDTIGQKIAKRIDFGLKWLEKMPLQDGELPMFATLAATIFGGCQAFDTRSGRLGNLGILCGNT